MHHATSVAKTDWNMTPGGLEKAECRFYVNDIHIKGAKAMTKETTDAQVLQEPDSEGDTESIWMRGVFMIILGIFFAVSKTILFVAALVQFIWMVTKDEKNQHIADFGEDLSVWMARVVEFQTAATENKPFPFSKWGQ